MEQETYIPGMNGGNLNDPYSPEAQTKSGHQIEQNKHNQQERSQCVYNAGTTNNANNTPVVGFLYSVSKNGFPEFWPLYIGQNRIGKDADMDICLREGSISDHHANIQIKKMRSNGGRLIATIVDAGSKNGIMINQEELDYDRHNLTHMDIITIGLNYKLVFLLVDPVELGLDISENFVQLGDLQSKNEVKEELFIPENATHSPHTSQPHQASPYGAPYGENASIRDETINIQGNYSGLNAGGTRIM